MRFTKWITDATDGLSRKMATQDSPVLGWTFAEAIVVGISPREIFHIISSAVRLAVLDTSLISLNNVMAWVVDFVILNKASCESKWGLTNLILMTIWFTWSLTSLVYCQGIARCDHSPAKNCPVLYSCTSKHACITWCHRGYLPSDSRDLQGHTLSSILFRLYGSCTIWPKVNVEQELGENFTFHIPSICRPLASCRCPFRINRPRCAYAWSIHGEPRILGWDTCCRSQVKPQLRGGKSSKITV